MLLEIDVKVTFKIWLLKQTNKKKPLCSYQERGFSSYQYNSEVLWNGVCIMNSKMTGYAFVATSHVTVSPWVTYTKQVPERQGCGWQQASYWGEKEYLNKIHVSFIVEHFDSTQVACKFCFEGVRDVIVIQGKVVLGKKQEMWAGREHSRCPSSPPHPTEKEGCLAGLSSYPPVLAGYLRAANSCLPPPGQLSPQKAKGTACLIIKHTVLEGTRIFLCLGQTRLVD